MRRVCETMTKQEKDRIESAIRHIKTATDVDEWAMEIAVEAMEKQIPKKPIHGTCPRCDRWLPLPYGYPNRCQNCGQAIDWSKE